MKVEVYHVEHFRDDVYLQRHPPIHHVATVEAPDGKFAEAFEYAWRWTNNIEGSWSRKIGTDANDAVTVHQERSDALGLRSSMVGDIFTANGIAYRVALSGFEISDIDCERLQELVDRVPDSLDNFVKVNYTVEVIADSSGQWVGNRLIYPDYDDAVDAAVDLERRWNMVRSWRVVPTFEEVTTFTAQEVIDNG